LSTLALLVVAAAAGLQLWSWWDRSDDVAVDFDPEAPVEPLRGSVSAWPESPDGRLVARLYGDRTFVVEAAGPEVFADLGEVGSTIFVSDDVLVAFSDDRFGVPEGAAVIDLGSQSVDQVDDLADADGPLHAMRVRDDGRVVVCEWGYHDDASAETCGTERFLLNPENAELELAPWSSPPPATDYYLGD
jgi:hypothetical protein